MSKYVEQVDDIAEACFVVALEKIRKEQFESITDGYPAWGANEYRAAVSDLAEEMLFEVYVDAIRQRMQEKVDNLVPS